MKNLNLILSLFIAIALSSCKKDPVPPGIQVTPNSFIQTADLGDVIEFTITGAAGDANLRSLDITTKPGGGVTSTIFEESLFGKSSTSTYVLDLAEFPADEQLVVFRVTDEDGYIGETVRRVILNADPALEESTGHNLYSNYSTGNTNGFNISNLDPLFLASLSDSTVVDLVQLDATDDDVQDNVLSSYSGIKFTRNNSFNYASAKLSTAASTYDSSIPLQTISNIAVDDILITKYDTINMLYAAIKVIEVQDLAGTENDRIVFNVKK
ncbi:MAG: hypothetical protein AB8B53_01820 [Flavobacteriales bacterium]